MDKTTFSGLADYKFDESNTNFYESSMSDFFKNLIPSNLTTISSNLSHNKSTKKNYFNTSLKFFTVKAKKSVAYKRCKSI